MKPAPTARSALSASLIAVGVLTSGCATIVPEAARPAAARSVIRAADGTPLAFRYEQNREPVSPEEIPALVRDALIAAEDARFLDHTGIDAPAVLRALVDTVRTGRVYGGSTISQQLAKMTYHPEERRTLGRKFSEAMLATKLEQRHTKDELLAMYLNRAYFGSDAYGIATAAETYLGKELADLRVHDAALLVGLVRAPTTLDPFRDPEAARERRSYVLRRMVEEQMIDRRTAARAERAPLGLRPRTPHRIRAAAFVTWIEELLLADPALGASDAERADRLMRGGLDVTTTLDLRMQRAAEAAVHSILGRADDPEVGLVALDPRTGAIKAMVGGRRFRFGDLNLAIRAARQPGSTFKPLALIAAMEQGIPPDASYRSAPTTLRWGPYGRARWRVRNYDGRDHGRLTLRDAMRLSVNGVYARLTLDIGPEAVIDVARRLGITAPMDPYPSVVLGALPSGVSALQMASAYGVLAAHGRLVTPQAITSVIDPTGSPIIETGPPDPIPAIDPGIAHLVTESLEEVVTRGTGTSAWFGRPAAGKTGTTDDHADAWFVGYTPQLAAAVWVGYPDRSRPMRDVRGVRVTGSSFPAAIWRRFMAEAHRGLPVRSFEPAPHALLEVMVGPSGNCLASAGGTVEYLPPTLVPTRRCPSPSPTPSATPRPSPGSGSAVDVGAGEEG